MIVIGDVHGQFNMLMRLMDKLPQTQEICFVGDLIDRGPDSNKVIEFVRSNTNYKCVMGNHEDLIRDYLLWMRNSGYETLKSYDMSYDDFVKSDIVEWIEELPILIQWEDYIISHSYAWNGINTPNHHLLWSRSFPRSNGAFKSIFGHTPIRNAQKILDRHWNIDTGAVFGNKLSAIDLTDESIYFVEFDDKMDKVMSTDD